MGPAGCHPSGGSFGDVVLASVLAWANTYNTYKYKLDIHAIHTDTYRYQRRHTHTYTYIQPAISVWRGFCAAVATARDASAQCYLPRSSLTGLRAGLPRAKCVWNAYWLRMGVHFGPPNECCARGCAKTGPGVGPQWREKVVGHLPRGALSGARWVPPQWGVFSGTLCWLPCLPGPIHTIHTNTN